MYVQPLTYAYNTQVHRSTNVIPFSLVLSRQPPGPESTEYPTCLPTYFMTYIPVDKLRLRLHSRLSVMKAKIEANLTKSQRRYMKYFDRAVKFIPSIEPWMEVYIFKPPPSSKTQHVFLSSQPRSKTQHKTSGPFRVLAETSDTVIIREEGIHNTVSKYLPTVVPSGNVDNTGNPEGR